MNRLYVPKCVDNYLAINQYENLRRFYFIDELNKIQGE